MCTRRAMQDPIRASYRTPLFGRGLFWGWLVVVGSWVTVMGDSGMAEEVWRWSHPDPHGNNLADLVVGGVASAPVYIHVTERGGVYRSTDRVVWNRLESGSTADLRSAAFWGERLLVTGARGTAGWSDDGVRWTVARLEPATEDWLEGVAVGNGVAVAVGDFGAVYRSAEGTQWSRVAHAGGEDWLTSVTHGAGRFVAVGERGRVMWSEDGLAWTVLRVSAPVDFWRVAYGDGEFMAVGRGGAIWVSPDGAGWQPDAFPSGTTNALYAVAMGPGQRLVAGEDALLRKDVGGIWMDQRSLLVTPQPAPSWTYQAAVWDGDRFLAGGRTGVMVESLRTNLPFSGEVTLWYRSDDETAPRNWLWDADWVGGTYLAVGERGTVLSSANGLNWAVEEPPVDLETIWYGVGGSPDMGLIAGTRGQLYASLAETVGVTVTNTVMVGERNFEVMTTEDVSLLGVQWEVRAEGLTTNTLQGIGWQPGRYVVVGAGGTVLLSTNGLAWEKVTVAGGAFLTSVTPWRGGWVATGSQGTVVTSEDGRTWEAQDSGTEEWVYRVRAFSDGLVAVGRNGLILSSTNGTTWQSLASGTTAWLTDVREMGGVTTVVGTQGTLLQSTHRVDWQSVVLPTRKSLSAVVGHNGQWVVVGAEGIILRAVGPALGHPVAFRWYEQVHTEEDSVDLWIWEGTPERSFRLERAGALGDWITAGDEQLDSDGIAVGGRVADQDQGFYRTATP